MGFQVVDVPGLPSPGQFSHVVRKGNMVFISGQTAPEEAGAGNLDPYDQARRIYGYLRQAIAAAGGTMADIVKINTYVTDGSHFDAIRALRPEFFDRPYPAATSVVVHALARRELVMEIEAIAILDD